MEFLKVASVAENREGKAPADAIAKAVWNDLGSRDVRDAVRIARLLRDPADLPRIVDLLKRSLWARSFSGWCF